jgi:ParB family chromosome partitioning protein
MLMEKNNKSSKEPDKIEMIPLKKIEPFRWSKGIRDKEKYDQLKENIKEHGLNNPPKVRALENGNYEPFIGDHRVRIAQDLKWKEIPCIIRNIDKDEALEVCVSDNVCRADYNPIELEDKITELWNSQRYKSRAELGRKIGLTGERVGQLIKSKTVRDKSKGTLDKSISTQNIIDASSLENEDDRLALLQQIKDGKVKPGDIKKVARKLSKLDLETKNKILYEGADLTDISKEIETKVEEKMPKETKTTVTISKECKDLIPKLYDVCKEIGNYVGLMEDGKSEQAIEYIKVCAGLLLETLTKNNGLRQNTFESFVEKALKLDINILHKYDGTRTKTIEWWY